MVSNWPQFCQDFTLIGTISWINPPLGLKGILGNSILVGAGQLVANMTVKIPLLEGWRRYSGPWSLQCYRQCHPGWSKHSHHLPNSLSPPWGPHGQHQFQRATANYLGHPQKPSKTCHLHPTCINQSTSRNRGRQSLFPQKSRHQKPTPKTEIYQKSWNPNFRSVLQCSDLKVYFSWKQHTLIRSPIGSALWMTCSQNQQHNQDVGKDLLGGSLSKEQERCGLLRWYCNHMGKRGQDFSPSVSNNVEAEDVPQGFSDNEFSFCRNVADDTFIFNFSYTCHIPEEEAGWIERKTCLS